MSEKTQITNSNTWKCMTCKDQPEFQTGNEVKEHLTVAHGIDTSKIKANMTMVSHIDAAKWYSFTYDVEVGNVKLALKEVRLRKKK